MATGVFARLRHAFVNRDEIPVRSPDASQSSGTDVLPLSAVDLGTDSRVSLTAFPAPALPGFSSLDWSSSCNGTTQSSDFHRVVCRSCLFDLSGILNQSASGVSRLLKNSVDLTGCIIDIVYRANGPSTPGLRCPLAMTRTSMLPSSMQTPWAGGHQRLTQAHAPCPRCHFHDLTDRYKDFGAQYHSQPDGHARSVHPHDLSVYASKCLLPDTLQHSIASLRLRATRTGFTPACQQSISSPHLHCVVNQRRVLRETLRTSTVYCRRVEMEALDGDFALPPNNTSGMAKWKRNIVPAMATATGSC